MNVEMTEYLRVNLSTEQWECRVCGHVIGSAQHSYKWGLLVYNRNPEDIHPSIIDPEQYRYTFSPDPNWVRILEYYCPHCATMVETEYATPGHPPLYDMELDLEALKAQWQKRGPSSTVKGPTVERQTGHTHG
jgi:acetone carboxylase gamma subunit